MALPYEILLARRNLSRHPWHTAVMIVGLALAVVVMIYIPSTMSSFYDDIIDRAVEQNSAHVTLWPLERPPAAELAQPASGPPTVLAAEDHTTPRRRDLNGYHALTAQVERTPGVIAVAAFVHGDATLSLGRTSAGVRLEGIDPAQYGRVVRIDRQFPGGRVPDLGPDDVLIGFRLAEKLGVQEGDHVRLATAQTPQRQLRVRGIFRAGYYEQDLSCAYVSLHTAQGLLGMGTQVSGLAVRCEGLTQARAVSAELARTMNLKVRNWMDDNASLLTEIATIKRVTLFINVLVAMAAAVGIINVFSVFVLSRQKELAILRAMGASRPSLRLILLAEAVFIWVFGMLLGCAAALAGMAFEQAHPYQVSAELYGIGSYATVPKPAAFVIAAVLAGAAMAGAAWSSGRRAARLDPAQVIFGR